MHLRHMLCATLVVCWTADALCEEPPNDATSASEETVAPLAGHSGHGAAYNEGPRQDAYLMGGTGSVHFDVTTDNDEARQFFVQGIGQLHGFWYFEAERSFRRVAALDPQCAMAYWGMAFANVDNKERAREFIAESTQRIDQASPREKMYIEALSEYLKDDKRKGKRRRQDYINALEKIIRGYPEDIEAKAFLAVHLWQSNREGIPISSHAAVDALLDGVFQVEPNHPAHHFRIHLWDREEPAQALKSAASCGQAAPSIAHMWHMPGHIYARLKRYADSAWQQEASARADHAYMMRDWVLPDQIHNYAHNNEWLIRNLIHLGRARDALDLAKNMLELPRHPKYNAFDRNGNSSCKYGRTRLIQVLETFEMWDETIKLADTMYLEPTEIPVEQAKRWRLLGVARHHQGDFAGAQRALDELNSLNESVSAELEQLKQKDKEEKSKKSDTDETADEKPDADAKESDAKDDDDSKQKRKQQTLKLKRGQTAAKSAIAELETLKLLARGETELAKEQLRKLKGVPQLRMARYRFRAGDHTKTQEILEKSVEKGTNEVPPLALQVNLLQAMGKIEEAKSAMEQLRVVAAEANLDSPVLQRLAPIAKKWKLPAAWQQQRERADDVGQRPELASLGPFRWSPPSAPDWSLPDSSGGEISLQDYRGRPVVVIFYLGFGCLHCVEQLQKFAPHHEEFVEAGIDMVAISVESPVLIANALENFNDGVFPIPLLSDERLDVFRAYHAHDDFEQMALHGTFLIDTESRIRWHDISYEPFIDPTFVLAEAQRVLALDAAPTSQVSLAE